MKEIIFHPEPFDTQIQDVPIPTPSDDDILLKVKAAGTNPKDWHHPKLQRISLNSGDDAAGVVAAIGAKVATAGEFRVGDRVAGFHRINTPNGTYAEYTIVPSHTAFHIPDNVSFEEAATIPLITLTAAISLFRRQKISYTPWSPRPASAPPLPLLIYNASSAVGSSAIKLASASNIHPIIAIAGSTSLDSPVSKLLSPNQGDILLNYHSDFPSLQAAVRAACPPERPLRNTLDAFSADESWVRLSQLLDRSTSSSSNSNSGSSTRSQLSVLSGRNRYDEPAIRPEVDLKYTYVGTVHEGAYRPGMPKQPAPASAEAEEVKADPEFAYLLMRYVGRMLAEGRYSGHPVEVVPGGLETGVREALRRLRDGEAGGRKFVVRVDET